MKMSLYPDQLHVGGFERLSVENADALRREICKALTPAIHTIELDFAEAVFVDSYGLGALVAIYRTAAREQPHVKLRIKNPAAHILQLMELTRLHRLFDIQLAVLTGVAVQAAESRALPPPAGA